MPRTTKKRSYHHGNLRESLVEAAIAIADEEGMAALSTREVARRLGVSHGAPARHFESRGALLAEVATVAYERFTAELETAERGHPEPNAALAAMGRAYVRFSLDHPGLVRLMFSPEISDPAVRSERLEQASRNAYEALQSAVRRTMRDDATEEQVAVGTFHAWSSVHGAAMLWLDGPMRGFFEGDAKAQFLGLADAMIRETARAVASSS